MLPTFNAHGSRLQQLHNTRSVTENSTATTAKQTLSRTAGRGLGERRQSAASDNSKIPVRKTSENSVGSASIGQPRPAGGRPLHHTPTMHPPLAQTGLISGFNVTILCENNEIGFKLELNASGAIFYESLNQALKKRVQRELNRDLDQVRFTPHRDSLGDCCWVSLMEDQVAHDWANAVEWFNRLKAGCKIYAVVVGPDDD
jgi:hypothetical protein